MKIKLNHILAAIVVVLLALCWASVRRPMHFADQRKQREAEVIQRLTEIRKAEKAYRQRFGIYAGTFRQLVGSGLLADSLRYVPYSEGQEFELAASVHTGKSGAAVPVMECGAPYNAYLQGLDENSIRELTEEANERGEYPGMKFGDITTPNDNAGNWE